MEAEQQKIIFLNSYSPRTGHNFTSEVIKIFSDHKVLAHNRSETRLSVLLDSYYEIYDKTIFHQTDKDFFDKLFIINLREKILNLSESEKEFIMIKDTSFIGADQLPKIFPNDVHLILIRDPKSVFLSLFKAMNLKGSWKNRIKKWGTVTGLYPYYYSKKISNKILKEMPDLKYSKIIRYENLVKQEETTLLFLKELFDTEKDLKQIKSEIDLIPVINTSFIEENKAKNIWDQKIKSNNFKPLDRKGGDFILRKGIEMGSRKLRQKLNYI